MKRLDIHYPSVIAHRGASALAPESTKLAYLRAITENADYLEADLQRSKDGVIVIFHDRNLKKLSNVEEIFPARNNYELENFTYQELKKLDIGSWFNKKYPQKAKKEFQGLKIITLRELLEIANSKERETGLFLEFKHPQLYPGIEEETITILREMGWLKKNNKNKKEDASVERLVFLSFNLNSLEKLKELAPSCPRILLVNDNMISRKSWDNWLELAQKYAHGLGPKGFMAWPWYIARAHNKGLFVAPYVINQAWQVKILSHFKADAYITDKPDLIINFLKRIDNISANLHN
ncbi:glycerophosphodiester phosphodiesterase family protein [Natronospora cellulosivora (SeqCode)]